VFLKIVFVFLLVGLNGFFVAAEFALVKIRLGDVQAGVREGLRSAKLVENILDHLDAYLSACQLGITLASLGLGWVGEPMVATSITPLLARVGVSAHNVHYFSFPLAFGLITFLHITAGEQVPKMLAIQKFRGTAYFVSVPLSIFYKVFRPFIWALNSASNFMLRGIGINYGSEHSAATEDELRMILLETAQGGDVSLRERLMMANVLDLEEKTARSRMLPRNQIIFLDHEDPIDDQLRHLASSGHTRLPLCMGDLDHVLGIIHVKDVFQKLAEGNPPTDLRELMRPPVFILETMLLDRLLRELQKSRAIMALLVNEFGVVSGMITLENVLEEVVGPIQDEFDTEVPQIRKVGPHSFEIDANCPLNTVKRELHLKVREVNAETIGGLVVEMLEHIPRVGEQLTICDHRITITAAEPTCVRVLSIEKIPASEPIPPEKKV
jgi:magnesium and cobalt exporter, CNNM family